MRCEKKSIAAKLREAKRSAGNPPVKIWLKYASVICDLSSCWLWTRMEKGRRYPRLIVKRKEYQLSHLVWLWVQGSLPQGRYVCHHCDVPLCVRPSHLFLGTAKDNAHDRDSKGRGAKGSRNGNAKLTEDQVRKIRRGGRSIAELSKAYGVTREMISLIRLGKFWRDDLAHVKPVREEP